MQLRFYQGGYVYADFSSGGAHNPEAYKILNEYVPVSYLPDIVSQTNELAIVQGLYSEDGS